MSGRNVSEHWIAHSAALTGRAALEAEIESITDWKGLLLFSLKLEKVRAQWGNSIVRASKGNSTVGATTE